MVGEAHAGALKGIQPGEEHRAFYHLSVPKKFAIMARGILTSPVLGIVLLAVAASVVGIPGRTTALSIVASCTPSDIDADAPCQDSDLASPVSAAGIWVGDGIVPWGGVKVSTWEGLQTWTAAAGTSSAEVFIEHGGVERTANVTAIETQRIVRDAQDVPIRDTSGAMRTRVRPYVDISPPLGTISPSPTKIPGIIGQATGGTARAIATLPVGLYHTVQAALGVEQHSADDGIAGLVDMGRMAGNVISGDVARGGAVPLSMRVSAMLMLLGSLNLALFAFDPAPLLSLDGGHMFGICWEGIRYSIAKAQGRPDPGPVDTTRMLLVGQAALGLLIVMVLVLMWVNVAASL